MVGGRTDLEPICECLSLTSYSNNRRERGGGEEGAGMEGGREEVRKREREREKVADHSIGTFKEVFRRPKSLLL